MSKERHWYFLVQYIDQEGFESRKEFIRINRSHYKTDNGCWKAALEKIFEEKEDCEDISDVTLMAQGWEEKDRWSIIEN